MLKKIIYFETVTSTNALAKNFLSNKENISENFVIVSNRQLKGRGKGSRGFISPADVGVYMSIVLIRPQIDLEKVSVVASLAVFRTIKRVAGLNVKIKQPNDILINGKKVCGILIESALKSVSNTQEYVIVGLGINVNNEVFDSSIEKSATSLKKQIGKVIDKNFLISVLINEFEILMKSNFDDLATEYIACLEKDGFAKCN